MSTHRPRRDLIGRLLGPAVPEVTCEECFELLDQYVDLELAGEDVDALLPGMRAHLAGCPACHEDHESLRDEATITEASRTPASSHPADRTRAGRSDGDWSPKASE